MNSKKSYLLIGALFWLAVLVLSSYWVSLSSSKEKQEDSTVYKIKNRVNGYEVLPPSSIADRDSQTQENNEEIKPELKKPSSRVNEYSKNKFSIQTEKKNQYWVQIYAFSKDNLSSAEKSIDELKKSGIEGKIIESTNKLKILVGPFEDQTLANIEKNKLNEKTERTDIFIYSEEK